MMDLISTISTISGTTDLSLGHGTREINAGGMSHLTQN